MIGTATSIISINYTYTPKMITAQSTTWIFNGRTFYWPSSWFGPMCRDWDTPEEDAAWQHLNEVKPKD